MKVRLSFALAVLLATGLIGIGILFVVSQLPVGDEPFACADGTSLAGSDASSPASSLSANLEQELRIAPEETLQEFSNSRGLTKILRRKELQRQLETRKASLVALARTDPAAASAVLLPPNEAQALRRVSSNCVEATTTVKGKVQVLHKHLDPTTAVNEITLQTDGGEKRLYVSPDDQQTIESASVVKVSGFSFAEDDEVFAYYAPTGGPSTNPVEVLQPAVTAAAAKTEKLLVLLGDYQNTNVVLPTVQEAERVAQFSRQYFLENSYGNLTLDYSVSGIHEMAIDRDDTCPFVQVAGALVAAADPFVDFTPYDKQHLAIFAPFKDWYAGETTDPSCHWFAIATTYLASFQTDEGTIEMTVAGYRSPTSEPMSNGILQHELAHNIAGAGHGNWAACPSGVTFYNGTTCKPYGDGSWNQELEYRDVYDTLGGWIDRPPYLFDQGHFSAPRKEWVGWFDQSNVATVWDGGSPQRFTLEPIERPGPGLKTVKIERGVNDYLFVEYRQPNFADGQQNLDGLMFSTELPNVFEGALFHLRRGTATELLDATPDPTNDNATPTLPVGQTLTDPASGATVTVVSKTPDALTIDVTSPHIDYFAPPAPAYINDGLGSDEDTTSSTTSLSANWAAVVDAGSGLDQYEYAITDQNWNNIVDFTGIGTATSATVDTLNLTAGKTYYFWIRAVDRAGNVGYSHATDGITVTGTQPPADPPLPTASTPRPPGLVVDGNDVFNDQAFTGQPSVLQGSWSLSPDRNTNVSRYQYAIGTTAGGTDVVGFTNIDKNTSVTRYDLNLQGGQTYYFSVRAVSLDGATAGPTRSSNGITVDVTPPPAPGFVYDGLGADEDQTGSLNTLKANWEAVSDASGVLYQYAIGTTPGATDIMTYTDLWDVLSVIQGGLNLANNTRYYVAVRAVDTVGNYGAPTVSDGILTNASLDTEPPSVAIVSPTDNATVSGFVALTADASDDYFVEGVQFRLNGDNLGTEDITAPFEMTWDVTYTTPGAYTLTAVARDAAGRRTTSASVTVNVTAGPDTDPPFVGITYPQNNAVISGTSWISGQAADNVGVIGTQLKIDGTNFGPEITGDSFFAQWNTLTVCNGFHTLTAVSRDGANNTATASVTPRAANPPADQPAGCDTTAPPAPLTVNDGTGTDQIATNSVTTLSANWTPVVDGGSGLLKYEYAIGTTPGGTEVVPFTDANATSITKTGLTLNNGQMYYTTVLARDIANNVSPETRSNGITVDTVAPTLTAIPNPSGTVVGVTNIDVTASDNVGLQKVEILVDNVLVGTDTTAPYSISWDSRSIANGSHTILAKVYDHAANQVAGSKNITVDNPPPPETMPPTVSIAAPLNGATVAGSVQLSATASDNVGVVGVQFKLDGENLQAEDTAAPYGVAWNTALVVNGQHALTAVARDAVGNYTTSASLTVTVRNDQANPTVTITAPSNGETVKGTVNITADASDDIGVLGVQFTLDGNNLLPEDLSVPYAVAWDSTSVSNGQHRISAIARDAAGKTANPEGIVVTVDNTETQTPSPAPSPDVTPVQDPAALPSITLTEPAEGATVSGLVKVVAEVSSRGLQRVQFYYDNQQLISEDAEAPYETTWDTSTVADGVHVIFARVTGPGVAVTSATRQVNVENVPDAGGPEAVLDVRKTNNLVKGRSVRLTLEPNGLPVRSVTFFVDRTSIATDTSSPYRASWDSRRVVNGRHVVTASFTLASGEQLSIAESVTVRNRLEVQVAKPKKGTVKGRYRIVPTILGGDGTKKVEYTQQPNRRLAVRTKPPFWTVWNTKTVRNGSYTIKITVTDKAGKKASTNLRVKVRN